MKKFDAEYVRETVRQRYGKIARGKSGSSCCGEGSALSGCGCRDGAFSPDSVAKKIGYQPEDLAHLPDGANMGLGCGNPVARASIKPGDTVVDLGAGGGFDCFIAAKKVGESGQVIGVDMTPEMVSKARENAEKQSLRNVEFRLGEIEHLPVADDTADIVISNCVINLSSDKRKVYQDVFRVLKKGGRLAISDILAKRELSEKIRADLDLYCACIGGAQTIDETRNVLDDVGFKNIRITINEKAGDLIRSMTDSWEEEGAPSVVSAYIEAIK